VVSNGHVGVHFVRALTLSEPLLQLFFEDPRPYTIANLAVESVAKLTFCTPANTNSP